MALAGFNGWATNGGQPVYTSGLASSTLVQDSHPLCQVAVYLSGTTTLATIFADPQGTPLANPFTAGTNGFWMFWADATNLVDVQMSGGVPPFTAPITLPAVTGNNFGGAGIFVGILSINADTTPAQQIVAGTGIVITELGHGVTVITATASLPPNILAAIVLNPSSVQGGSSSTGTVILSTAAPAGGALVSLFSSSPSAQVPASVTVPAGLSTATFTVTTSVVSSTVTVSITGNYNGIQAASLTVTPPPPLPTLASVALNPTSVQGGASSTGTATLSGAAPAGGAVVTLSSSDTAAATVPATVTVAAGATSATFTVATSAVTAPTTVSISGNYGVTQSASLTVTPPPALPTLASITITPLAVQGGTPATGTATLTAAAPAGGAVVTLSSSNTAAATVPATVTIPAGFSSVGFAVTTFSVSVTASVTIFGTYGVTQSGNLTVQATTLPQPIYGGVGGAGGSAPINVVGTVAILSNNVQLPQLQATPEQIGQSWSFTPSNENIYLLLYGGAHTFTDQTGFNFVMNAPIAVTVAGSPMFLYQSTNALLFPTTVKIAT